MAGDAHAGRRWSMWASRAVFAVAIVSGVVLVVVSLTRSAVDSARAGDDLVELASPVLSDAGLAKLRADYDTLAATGSALTERGIPHLAERTGSTTDQFLAALAASDPQLAQALQDLPTVTDLGGRIVTNLERRQGEFDSAASLPGLGLTLEQGAWLLLGTGVALIAIGVVGLIWPRQAIVGIVTVVGAVLVVAPLALGYPAKTSDTDAILDSLRPFSVAKVEQREAALTTVQTVLAGTHDVILPAVATSTGTSVDDVAADLGTVDPALTPQRFTEAGTVMGGFASLVGFSRTIQPLLVQATELPSTAFMWLTIVPGAALVLSGAGALVLARRTPSRGARAGDAALAATGPSASAY